jgi:drug/metabolite transporter (DMT)-like permease
LESGLVWIGILLLILFFVAYTLVLSWADYSFVQPASSIGYGVVAVLGYFLLGEAVTSTRWIGVAIICMGVFLVSRTPPRTTEQI